MYAFIINHFGNNPKYLEYELFFLLSFRNKTTHDIVYFYSINDTPEKFINIIKSLNIDIIIIPYDDNNITFNIPFESSYTHFNLLRTCNYIFAYTLTQYSKICIVESDMIILNNIDDIFELKTPSIIYYKFLNTNKINKNIHISLSSVELTKLLENCSKESYTNGGVILFEPSIKIFNNLINNIKLMIDKKCIYPSETLFLYTIKNFYNLPIKYNLSHFFISSHDKLHDIRILHYNNTLYKPIDIIRDTTYDINKIKNSYKKKVICNYKNNDYKKYNLIVDKIMKLFHEKKLNGGTIIKSNFTINNEIVKHYFNKYLKYKYKYLLK